MSAATAVARGRVAAEAQMVTVCAITRPSAKPEPVWDEETGTYTEPEAPVIYAGRCKLQNNSRAVAEVLAGERRAGIDNLELHLPIVAGPDDTGDPVAVRRNDVARIVANPLDPALEGRDLVVQAEPMGSIRTARRLSVEAVF